MKTVRRTIQIECYGRQLVELEINSAGQVRPAKVDGAAWRTIEQACEELGRAPLASGFIRSPAHQIEAEVRSAVESALRSLEHKSPIIAEVLGDSSGVGYIARVTYQITERTVSALRTDGCTFHGGGDYPFRAAAEEAEECAIRACQGNTARIQRYGYSEDDASWRNGAPGKNGGEK